MECQFCFSEISHEAPRFALPDPKTLDDIFPIRYACLRCASIKGICCPIHKVSHWTKLSGVSLCHRCIDEETALLVTVYPAIEEQLRRQSEQGYGNLMMEAFAMNQLLGVEGGLTLSYQSPVETVEAMHRIICRMLVVRSLVSHELPQALVNGLTDSRSFRSLTELVPVLHQLHLSRPL